MLTSRPSLLRALNALRRPLPLTAGPTTSGGENARLPSDRDLTVLAGAVAGIVALGGAGLRIESSANQEKRSRFLFENHIEEGCFLITRNESGCKALLKRLCVWNLPIMITSQEEQFLLMILHCLWLLLLTLTIQTSSLRGSMNWTTVHILEMPALPLRSLKLLPNCGEVFQPLALAIFSYGKVHGFLTKQDFQRAASHVCGISVSDNVVNVIFHVFDANRDGSLSSEEFLRALERWESDVRQPTETLVSQGFCHAG